MKRLERKFKHGKGIIQIPTSLNSITDEKEIKYCSFWRHEGVLTEARIEFKNCYSCEYFRIYSSRKP